MNIAVLIKQVPDTEAVISIGDDGKSVKTGEAKWVINPYDEYAVEEALRLREAHGGLVTVLTLGPEKSVEALRTALAMGADAAIRIDAGGPMGLDGLMTARILAQALKKLEPDLILCGQRAVDDDGYQVGGAVAHYLDLPQISMAAKVEVQDRTLTCRRAVEGAVVVTATPLPALVTTQKGLNEPRFASMMGIMKAKKKPVDVHTLQDLGLDPAALGSPKVRIRSMERPVEKREGKIISGTTPGEQAAQLARSLRDAGII